MNIQYVNRHLGFVCLIREQEIEGEEISRWEEKTREIGEKWKKKYLN